MNIIEKYFPQLSDKQKEQIAALDGLYRDWNAKINVISRKDIDNLYEHHVLHSMAIAKAINFRPGTEILDFGCGGGFPGIPLAILFPECKFKLIDGTGKKIKVCKEVASAIGLENLVAEHLRGEEEKGHGFNRCCRYRVERREDKYNRHSRSFRLCGRHERRHPRGGQRAHRHCGGLRLRRRCREGSQGGERQRHFENVRHHTLRRGQYRFL